MIVLFTVKLFKTIAVMTLKLHIAEVGIFNVCGRPLFANPVTNLPIILTDFDGIVFTKCRPETDQTSAFEINTLPNLCGI